METVETVRREMCILDGGGDTKVIWDPANADEVKNAKRTFKDLLKKGFTAFRVDTDGEKDGQIREFEPDAQKLIMVPRIMGG